MTASDTITQHVHTVVRAANAAATRLAMVPTAAKNDALERIATELERQAEDILAANVADVADTRIAVERGQCAQTLLDRLRIDSVGLGAMIAGLRTVAALEDPVGRILERTRLDDRLELERVTVPLGVVAAIFEARPDAVTQISALALKAGNAVVLKGGSEAARTTRALVACMRRALAATNDVSEHAISAIEHRASVDALLALEDGIDLIVPRGSNALVRMVQRSARVPVLGHGSGVCHVYVDRHADPNMAVEIILDSKVQYPAACNAAETVLVHADVASQLLLPLLSRLAHAGVEVRGCERTRTIASVTAPRTLLVPAAEDDWGREYGALILACKVVDDIEAAVAHVNMYGSGHTETIVTDDQGAATYFLGQVDAASVFHNVSTRFADGYRFGLGAEVGISTGKLHARGPVGLAGLTTYKYLLRGHGHVVASYAGPNARAFLHERLSP